MGTAIGDLVIKKDIKLEELKYKKLGVDAYNIIYQFLTTIRDINGDLLKNSEGITTSHLIGLFHRLINILEKNIDLVFVFDGKPLDLKKETLEKRLALKLEAQEKAKASIDKEEIKKQKSRTSHITPEIVESTKELLDAFGIPYLTAKADAEAQLSYFNANNKIDGVISQDYDSLLFGTKDLYRNITISGKKKLPNKNYYIAINPQHINAKETLTNLGITRQKLIWIGILIGTDFNEKVPKIGPKTALKLVKKYNSLEEIYKNLNYNPKFNYKEIETIFLNPPHYDIEIPEKKQINIEKIKELLIEKYEFNKERVETSLEKINLDNLKQNKLSKWF